MECSSRAYGRWNPEENDYFLAFSCRINIKYTLLALFNSKQSYSKFMVNEVSLLNRPDFRNFQLPWDSKFKDFKVTFNGAYEAPYYILGIRKSSWLIYWIRL